MHRQLAIGALGLFILLSGAMARTKLDGTPGQGVLRINREKSKVVKAYFKDLGDDRYQVTFELEDGTTMNFKRTYTGTGYRHFLTIQHGFGQGDRAISGHGEVRLVDSRGEIDYLQASGEINDENSFNLMFEGTGRSGRMARDGDDNREMHSFSDHVRGSGHVQLDDKRWRLTRLEITMSRGGQLTVVASGPDGEDHNWTGTWYGNGPVFDAEFHRGGKHSVEANGKITLSGNKRTFVAIEMSARTGGRDWKLIFNAD